MTELDFKECSGENFEIKLADDIDIDLELSGEEEFDLEASVTDVIGGDAYEGEYEVTPTNTDIVLDTDGSVLTKDIVVKAVPTYAVSNTAGGTTFVIG